MHRKANVYDQAKNFVGLGKITFRASNFRKLFQSYLAMLTTNTKIVLIAAMNLFISNKCYAQVLNDSSILRTNTPQGSSSALLWPELAADSMSSSL